MAEITLRRHEYAEKHLPGCCAVCGGKDEVDFVSTRLKTVQQAANRTVQRWVQAQMPLCAEHADHFQQLKKTFFVWMSIVFLYFMVVMGCTVAVSSIAGANYGGLVFGLGILLVIAGEAGLVYVTYRKLRHFIRTQEITSDGVHLSNLAAKFVRAVKEFRVDHPYKPRYDDDDDEEDDDRPRRRRKARSDDDDDDEDDPPRRRRR